jgi:hypothetical protein
MLFFLNKRISDILKGNTELVTSSHALFALKGSVSFKLSYRMSYFHVSLSTESRVGSKAVGKSSRWTRRGRKTDLCFLANPPARLESCLMCCGEYFMHGAESPASVSRIYLFLASFVKGWESQGRKACARGGNELLFPLRLPCAIKIQLQLLCRQSNFTRKWHYFSIIMAHSHASLTFRRI